MTTTLIISPDAQWCTQAKHHLLQQSMQCDVAYTGKEAQLKAYNQAYDYFFLDLETKDHSGIEVCKYLRNARPQGKIFVTVASEAKLSEMFLTEKNLIKMGVTKVIFKPSFDSLMSHIQSLGKVKTWENITEKARTSSAEESDAEISDSEFSRVKIKEIFGESLAVFDYYLRLRSNRYVKIIHKGEKPSPEQLQKYETSGAEYIYFKTSDRSTFISYQNDLARQSIQKNQNESAKVIKTMKSVTDKYLEEVYVSGIQPQLIEEGRSICQNLYDTTMRDRNLKTMLNDLEAFNPQAYSHAFLVTFFSTIICKNLDWVGSKTIHTLALGALFHDIGILQLPESMRDKSEDQLSKEDLLIYQTHPTLGAENLKSIPGINNGVVQIIQQHHEFVNGSGYPSRLTANKIYPLAKIISLADGFSEFLKETGQSPKDGLRSFLSSPMIISQYDPELIKNLIKAL